MPCDFERKLVVPGRNADFTVIQSYRVTEVNGRATLVDNECIFLNFTLFKSDLVKHQPAAFGPDNGRRLAMSVAKHHSYHIIPVRHPGRKIIGSTAVVGWSCIKIISVAVKVIVVRDIVATSHTDRHRLQVALQSTVQTADTLHDAFCI